MSKYLDDNYESEDIDALNDETFGGCGIDDINNDWEEEHEKYVETSCERSSQFIDTGSLLETVDPSNNSSFAQYHFSKHEFINDSFNNRQNRLNNDDIFPNCADITKSVLDVVSDDDDFLFDIYSCFSSSFDNDVQNGALRNTKSTKEKMKNIDLESLRPPSPSILPVDLTFMSKVWRPPSPDVALQALTNNHQQTPKESSKPATPVPSQPLIELEKNQINFPTKIIRLEDLEAELKSPVNFPSPNNNANNDNTINDNRIKTSNASEPLIDLSTCNQLSMKNPAVIPAKSMKIVQPPPGFSTKIAPLATTPPPTLQPLETKISPIKQLNNHENAKAIYPPVHMESFLNLVNYFPKMMNLNFPSTVTLEQQRVMNKIITPAQAQRSYRHMVNFNNNRNQDKYSGFMTQKEKDWLMRVFRIQCKVNDPYVEDYYEVNYMLKKNSLNRIAKQKETMINEGGEKSSESEIKDEEPVLVLPQLAHVDDSKPKYIQFDNALGKIQVLNSKCPRKLVEFSSEAFQNYKLDLKSQYLLKIERLYEHFFNIEDEDKRMPILPENVKQQHRDKRMELCTLLFKGLTVSSVNDKKDDKQYFILIQRSMLTLKRISLQVDPQLLKINKGLLLIIRSLSKLEDEHHLIVLISSLLIGEIFQKILQVENEFQITIGNAISKAISQIQTAKSLIYITSCIDNANIFIDNKVNKRNLLMFNLILIFFKLNLVWIRFIG